MKFLFLLLVAVSSVSNAQGTSWTKLDQKNILKSMCIEIMSSGTHLVQEGKEAYCGCVSEKVIAAKIIDKTTTFSKAIKGVNLSECDEAGNSQRKLKEGWDYQHKTELLGALVLQLKSDTSSYLNCIYDYIVTSYDQKYYSENTDKALLELKKVGVVPSCKNVPEDYKPKFY
jgi:hypothetical protein